MSSLYLNHDKAKKIYTSHVIKNDMGVLVVDEIKSPGKWCLFDYCQGDKPKGFCQVVEGVYLCKVHLGLVEKRIVPALSKYQTIGAKNFLALDIYRILYP